MESTFTLLKVRGIPIGVNWSWLLIFGLVVWSLAQVMFPATYPGYSGTTYMVMAFVAAGLFFTSVLLHELGHALEAQREGMPIKGITLWLFGGVARLAGSPPSPRAEFHVAICGPVVSLVLAGGFLGGAWAGDQLGWPGTVRGVVDYLGRINLAVLAFNLIPALPLDGGRVLRSWLWQRQRSFIAATRSAARVGQAFGWMLVGIGVLGLFGGGRSFGGLWLALIGWFLVQAARGEATQAVVRQALGDLRVRDLMRPVPPGETAAAAPASGPGANGGPPSPHQPAVPAAAGRTATVEADRPVYDAATELAETDGSVEVTEDGRRVGVLHVGDVNEALQVGLAQPPADEDTRSAGILVWLVVGAVILIAGASLYHPPYVVVAPGAAIDVSDEMKIKGVPVDQLSGRYLITTVTLRRPSALGAAWAAISGDKEVIPASDVFPPGVNPREYSRTQRQVFKESRQVAAAAAAQAVGLPVTLTGSGARVVQVVDGSPAQGVLRPGDVIIELDGQTIGTAQNLGEAVSSRPAGTRLGLVVERDDARQRLEVRSEELADVAGRPGIGVVVETRGLDVDLPFEITFSERDIGGPSAGLAYSLAIADLLDQRDFAAGRTIAATGTIALDGDVGPVGGVGQKTVAVEDAGADLFLVPQSEVSQASGEGLPVRGVGRLQDALSVLEEAGTVPA